MAQTVETLTLLRPARVSVTTITASTESKRRTWVGRLLSGLAVALLVWGGLVLQDGRVHRLFWQSR